MYSVFVYIAMIQDGSILYHGIVVSPRSYSSLFASSSSLIWSNSKSLVPYLHVHKNVRVFGENYFPNAGSKLPEMSIIIQLPVLV